MVRSPPSHHFESLNHEDEDMAAGTAGEGVERVEEASPPTSLLDLPDELLVEIFEEVYESFLPAAIEDYYLQGFLFVPSELMVNKRIFSLASPLWPRYLATPRRPNILDDFLFDLLSHSTFPSLVQHLATELPGDFPSLHAFALSHFINLTSLTICLTNTTSSHSGEWETIPRRMTDALKNLRDLPSLRDLDVQSRDALRDLLANSASGLDSVTTRPDDLTGIILPWRTMKRLCLKPESDRIMEPQNLLEGLDTAAEEGTVALQQLDMDFPICNLKEPELFNVASLQSVLAVLRDKSAPLRSLSMGLENDFSWPDPPSPSPSVEDLLIRGPRRWKSALLDSILLFLSTFPGLRTVRLSGFIFYSIDEPLSVSTATPISPALERVLEMLRIRSRVVEVRLTVLEGEREVRWTRSSAEGEEQFVAEVWHL